MTELMSDLSMPGTVSATAAAMPRYSAGIALHMVETIFCAWLGATAAAALAISRVCFGCFSAAVAAATGAMSGERRETELTMAEAFIGFSPTAVPTIASVAFARSAP